MIRALAKGSMLWAFGNMPGGPHLYRLLTRRAMGTQATHVEKLARVWPGYVQVWRDRAGLKLEGTRLWVHDGGWTVFPFLLGHMITGIGATVTNEEGEVLDRYTTHALESAILLDLGEKELARRLLARGETKSRAVIEATGGTLLEYVDSTAIPLDGSSKDLVHSGGRLEHYRPDKLRRFIAETYRVLAPGGVTSHVFDHRDHLYHADKHFSFLNHWRFGESSYRFLFGHRLLYHNRLLPAEIEKIFEDAGFEKIAVRRLMLPSGYAEDAIPAGSLCGLDRRRLATSFRDATDLDLHTAAAHYLFRKPRGAQSTGVSERQGMSGEQ